MIPRPGLKMRTLKSRSWVMSSRPQSPLRQSRNKIVGSHWHSVYPNILSLAASGMISWKPLHIASSLQILPLLSTNIVPWRQRHIERTLHVYKAWHYFVRMFSGVCTLNRLKGGVEINRTEPNHVDAKSCLVFAQMCFQALLAEPRIFWSYFFTELFYVHKHTTFFF